ncbi:MAG: hypothetical protein R3F20_14970 [Planctomycetota bacterium]
MSFRTLLAIVLLAAAARGQGFPVQFALDSNANGWGEGLIEPGPDRDGDGIPEFLTTSSAGFALCRGSDMSVLNFTPNGVPVGVYCSSFSGLCTATNVHFYGEDIAWIDDVDGDGHADIAVQRRREYEYTDCVLIFGSYSCSTTNHVFSGVEIVSGATFTRISFHEVFTPQGIGFGGRWIQPFHDVTGDGVGEVIMSGSDATRVLNPVTNTVAILLPNNYSTGLFLIDVQPCVSGGGDYDGDGWDDLFIGIRNFGTGQIEIRSGNPANPFVILTSFPGNGYFARGYEGGLILHDLTGDGIAEIAANYGTAGNFGTVVMSGADASVLYDTGYAFGRAPELKKLPDLDGDGLPEFGIGGWHPTTAGGAGAVRIHRGSDLSLLHELSGPFPGARTRSFASVGDRDGDGFAEVLLGGNTQAAIAAGLLPPGPQMGRMRIESPLGWHRYGDPADHPLDLGRVNYASDPLQGPIVLTGGTPNGHGSLLGGFAADDMLYGPTAIPVLVDTGADFAFLIDNLPLDGSGAAQWPLDLRQPALDGVSLFLQFFDATNGLASSNGLALRFTD